ncbi:hypothetical protein N499_1091 [Wolbachia pipientis wVitA]|nr:hypothetical protein gwv_1091 [Wolbachia phage WO]ONI57173.1 hypothetical protein N499_1091 [Wolbachia pipientis wVitA]
MVIQIRFFSHNQVIVNWNNFSHLTKALTLDLGLKLVSRMIM